MKKIKNYLLVFSLTVTLAAQAQEKSISGIVAARLVSPDGATTAFVLVDSAKPTVAVTAAVAKLIAQMKTGGQGKW